MIMVIYHEIKKLKRCKKKEENMSNERVNTDG